MKVMHGLGRYSTVKMKKKTLSECSVTDTSCNYAKIKKFQSCNISDLSTLTTKCYLGNLPIG